MVSSISSHYGFDAPAARAEFRRVPRPGGRLVVTDWRDDHLSCKARDLHLRVVAPAHRRAYGTRECAALLEAAGYADPAVERYTVTCP